MRPFKGKSEGADVKMDMTPMIDVIFQLIIFFMCSIHFKSLEGKLQTWLAEGGPGLGQPIDEVRINIAHNKDNPLEPHLSIGQNKLADFESLYKEIANINDNCKRTNKIMPFKIDADPEVPVQMVTNVLNECKKVGVIKVIFAAHSPPTGPPDK